MGSGIADSTENSTEGRTVGYLNSGFRKWWGRWWLDTRGPVLGVAVPVALALVAAAVDARAIPLTVAGGIAAGLLWPIGKAAKALVIAGGAVVVAVAFVAATGPAGVLALFAMLVGWGFVALLAGGLYLIFKRPRIDSHYAARWASEEDTRDMVMWEEGHHPGEGVALGVHYGELIRVRPGFEGRREIGHFLVCGPSRSGKSLHLISNLLVWQGSAVALDIKGELFRLTAGIRGEMGDDVFALDPQGRGSRYDPFRPSARVRVICRKVAPRVLPPLPAPFRRPRAHTS